MALGGVPHTGASFDRYIQLVDTDGSTEIDVLNNRADGINHVSSASFDWRRLGGCGSGQFSIGKSFADRGLFEVGQHIVVKYSAAGDRWYFGRIEEVTEESPAGVNLRTEGLISVLNDLHIGGKGPYLDAAPKLYARSGIIYSGDPDLLFQSKYVATYLHSVIQQFYDQYIQPAGFGLQAIDTPATEVDFYSMAFRGEESVAECLRTLSLGCYGSSYGINPDGNFFFLNAPTSADHSFQEAGSLDALSRTTDRDLMYNYVDFVGNYVYIPPSLGAVPHYRYSSVWIYFESKDVHGPKRLQLYVPYVRNDQDAKVFIDQFFLKYGMPYTRYTFTTLGQGEPLFPWSTCVTLKDRAGTDLIVDEVFDSVKVEFNEAPIFTVTTGPEDLYFPVAPEPQHWEMPQGGGGGNNVPTLEPSWPSWYSTPSYYTPPTAESCDCPAGHIPVRARKCDDNKKVKICVPEEDIREGCVCAGSPDCEPCSCDSTSGTSGTSTSGSTSGESTSGTSGTSGNTSGSGGSTSGGSNDTSGGSGDTSDSGDTSGDTSGDDSDDTSGDTSGHTTDSHGDTSGDGSDDTSGSGSGGSGSGSGSGSGGSGSGSGSGSGGGSGSTDSSGGGSGSEPDECAGTSCAVWKYSTGLWQPCYVNTGACPPQCGGLACGLPPDAPGFEGLCAFISCDGTIQYGGECNFGDCAIGSGGS